MLRQSRDHYDAIVERCTSFGVGSSGLKIFASPGELGDFMAIEFGIETFGELPVNDAGNPVTYGQALRQVVEEAKLADEVGIDVIALGEHHRDDYAISPEMVLVPQPP